MSDHDSEKHRQLAVRIASSTNAAEKEALRVWIERLLAVKASSLSVAAKAKEAILLTARGGVAIPLVKFIGDEITPEPMKLLATGLMEIKTSSLSPLQKSKQATALIVRQFKLLAWDDRGLKARLAIAGSVVGVVLFGGQGAGIAALGTAIGVPLWVVFGAGATFLGILYEEITGNKPNPKTTSERKDQ
jgi:hypothetical protein